MRREDIQKFFDEQLALWPECAKRYADLDCARRKTVSIAGRDFQLIFNPARMRSATAKVVAGKVDRPCFLCRENRPAEQRDIPLQPVGSANRYLLSVNPFPILPLHFTIINDGHCRQTMTAERLRDMAFIAREMDGFLIFFNGACSGASAPDHFHFQAVPLPAAGGSWQNAGSCILHSELCIQKCEPDEIKIDFSRSDQMNILCWNTPEGLRWWVVNRRQHRPWQYEAEGAGKVLISPAALEFAGVVPLAREEDFDKMDAPLLEDILSQCQDKEPLIDVGIGQNLSNIERNSDGTTTVSDVRIGIGFHWDQRRAFRYEGQLFHKTDPATGEQWLVNRLPLEDYLRSVISSEMSATSSLELLKAHAVISRSWVLRNIKKNHTLFDVCSDDCCQRYQGVSEKMNPVVEQAIRETRGEVLMYDGEICDARYSKCCGGVTEEFRYCWENEDVPYLKSIRDARPDGTIFCDTKDEKILRQVLNDYDQRTHDFFTWSVRYTQEELSELIEKKLHLGLGLVKSLEPLERGKSGRISLLKIVGENGETTIGKELTIRKTLSESCLYSSNFNSVFCIPHSASSENSAFCTLHSAFQLTGRGWGHGVGLCQIGAAVMGAEGYDYKAILTHYYNNIEIKKIY